MQDIRCTPESIPRARGVEGKETCRRYRGRAGDRVGIVSGGCLGVNGPSPSASEQSTTGYRTFYGFQFRSKILRLQLDIEHSTVSSCRAYNWISNNLRFPVIDPVAVYDVWFGGEIYGRKALALQPARDVVGKDPCRRYRSRAGDRAGIVSGGF